MNQSENKSHLDKNTNVKFQMSDSTGGRNDTWLKPERLGHASATGEVIPRIRYPGQIERHKMTYGITYWQRDIDWRQRRSLGDSI